MQLTGGSALAGTCLVVFFETWHCARELAHKRKAELFFLGSLLRRRERSAASQIEARLPLRGLAACKHARRHSMSCVAAQRGAAQYGRAAADACD